MQSVSVKMAGHWKRWFMLLAFCVLLSGSGSAAELDTESGVLRSRVYTFKHISSQQAQDFFSQLHIGKRYNALTPDILIVTSDIGSDLVKATAISGVLDQSPLPKVEVLAADSQSLPKPDAFIDGLKSMTVGTLTEAPSKGSVNPAIIDVLDNKLIAIASEGVLNEIKAAFEKWEKVNRASVPENAASAPRAQTAVEPNEPARPAAKAPSSAEPLESIARQLFEAPTSAEQMFPAKTEPTERTELMTEPKESADPTPAESQEDFLSEGLLQELADARQEAEIQPAPDEPTVVERAAAMPPRPTTTPVPTADANKPVPEEDPMKILQALMAQARAGDQEAAAPQEIPLQPEATQPEPAPARSGQETKTADVSEQTSEPPAASSDQATESKIIQTAPPIAPQLAEEELETVMDLPQEVELESLVDLVGKQLGLNYLYDPAILKNQKVLLKVHGGKIKVKDVYSLLESVLKLKGFVMTRENQLVTIVKAENASQAFKQVDPVIRTPGEPIEAGNVIVSTLFQLTNISTDAARKMLISLNLGMTDGFQEIPETGTLLVTDYAYRMNRIEDVLSIIDVPGEKKEYEFRTLKYMTPSEMVPKLQDLAGKLEDVSLQISTSAAPAAPQTRTITTRDPRTGKAVTREVPVTTAAPAASAAAQKPQADTVLIDTDDRTNRILMAGKPGQIALVNELIDALDVPQFDLKFVREYLIQNVEAQDVVDVINQLGLASVSAASSTASAPSGRTATAAPARPGQPAQPQPAAPAAQTAAASGAAQPYISIRTASNSLLVNATAEQHKAIELVIAHVDVVQKDQRTIRQYEIQYVDTQEIMNTLTDLGIIVSQSTSAFGSSGRSSSTDPRSRSAAARTAQSGQPEVAEGAGLSLPTAEGGSEKDITAEQPQISILEATNSLLVYATPRQHDAIALVIAHADQTPETTSTPYVVYALENQDPVQLEHVLTELIKETVEEVSQTSSPESKIQSGGETTKLPTLEEQKIRIIADEMSYSLIVYANKRNQQWIAELIKELDEYRPQVLLDCTLVEITKDDQFQYNIELVSKTYDGTSLQPGTPVTQPPGVTAPFSSNTLGDASTIAGSITAFLNTGSVQAVLDAMQRKGFGRVMSQPKLLVNDNQEGEIKSETRTSIAQKQTIIQPGSEVGNTITTEDVSFNEYTSGVTLTIKPHISKGDMLRLEIELVRADFNERDPVTIGNSGEFPRPPDILSTNVRSVATVPDGTTIVLGGLETITQNKSQNKIPILGDIPLVGTLFRSVNDRDQQGKLYIFVKANIIRPGDQIGGMNDIRRVSKKYRDEFEAMENKFQKQDVFPGIKPKPMDPASVLEEDEEILGKLAD